MRPGSAIAAAPPRFLALERWIARYEPWGPVAAIVVLQWLTLVAFVLVVRRNGWLFYQGGDETFFHTDAWVLSRGHIPESEIGFGWSYLITPIAGIFGPSFISSLPALVLFQTLVLLPIAVCCVYGIAARIGGRLIGYFAALVWVLAPFASIPLWDHRYHAKFVEQFLPQAFGMTGLGDFPSMVCVLVAAYFCVRALDTHDLLDAALGGLAAGFAIGIKPANALFLAGPFLAFAAARRIRQGGAFGLALLPPLVALALWKYKGLGHLPFLTPAPKALAAGAGAVEGAALPLGLVVSRYVHFDWWRMHQNYLELREFFWSTRLLEWLPLAGFLAAVRRSWPKALLLGGWLGAFVLVKGSSDQASVESGILLRLFLPGFPPVLILAALIPLLVPTVGPRLWERFPVREVRLPRRRELAIAGGFVFGLLPVLLFAALRPLHGTHEVKYFDEHVIVPVDAGFTADVGRGGGGELVTWKPPSSGAAHVFYRVYRARPVVPAPDPTLPPGRDGIRCTPTSGASDCRLEMQFLGTTRATSFVDKPPAGPWTYRIALTANWLNDQSGGDVLLLSAPAHLSKFH
jgi:hypothetical protein